MQYLNPIYVTLHLLGHNIQIQLKEFLFWKRNPYGLYIFEIMMLIHLFYLEKLTT